MFTTDREIDLSIRKIITEEYLTKIKENKLEPKLASRNPLPVYVAVALGFVGLGVTSEAVRELPIPVQAVFAGLIVLLAASYEIERKQL